MSCPCLLQIEGRIHSLKTMCLLRAVPYIANWILLNRLYYESSRQMSGEVRCSSMCFFSPLPIKGVEGDEQMSTPVLVVLAIRWTESHHCAWELAEVWANSSPDHMLNKSPSCKGPCCKELGNDFFGYCYIHDHSYSLGALLQQNLSLCLTPKREGDNYILKVI